MMVCEELGQKVEYNFKKWVFKVNAVLDTSEINLKLYLNETELGLKTVEFIKVRGSLMDFHDWCNKFKANFESLIDE